MRKKLLMLGITFLAVICMAWGQDNTWTGVVSDSHCGIKHSAASSQAASCVGKCVAGGAKYVLVSGEKVYQLFPQDKFADFAGKSVKVTGAEKDGTITATEVAAAPEKS